MGGRKTDGAFSAVPSAISKMVSVRLPWTVLLLLVYGALPAQTVEIDTLRAVQPWGQHVEYTFPSVRLPNDPAVADSINRSLSIAFLGMDPHTSAKDPLSELWGDPRSSGVPRINNLRWTCERYAPGALTVHLIGEACGANCEGFDRHYTYDLRTGATLDLDKLFSETGRVVAEDSLALRWQRRLALRIDQLKAERAALGVSADAKTYQDEAIAMFEECMGMNVRRSAPIADFFPTPEGLRFITARCSHHVDQEMDDLFPLAIDLSREELFSLLRPAAREALGW
jgi:hypothetical protein